MHYTVKLQSQNLTKLLIILLQ